MSTTDPDTPDGRHLTRKGQATRQRIIAAAARLLEERGVAGVSVGDVQQAASVSAGQVYHYFPGKQALIRTVVRHRFRVTMDAQRPRLDHLDNLGALCAWRDLLVETQSRMTDAPRGLSIMAGELLRGVPECQPELVRGFDEWLNAISNGLRAMRDRGDLLPSADPDRLATGLLAAVQGGSLLACVHRDANRLGAALDEVIDHIALLIPDINADRARYHTTHRTEPHG